MEVATTSASCSSPPIGTTKSLEDVMLALDRSSEKELPSEGLLLVAIREMQDLVDRGGACGDRARSPPKWAEPARRVIRRLLQTRQLPNGLRSLALSLASAASETFLCWCVQDPELVLLLSALAAVELRMLLDREPVEIPSAENVAIVCRLVELLAEVGDDEAAINDDVATRLSYNVRDALLCLCDYVSCLREPASGTTPLPVEFVIKRCISSLLNRGLAAMVPEQLLAKTLIWVDLHDRLCNSC